MAIAHIATEYVFSDFLLKEPSESKYKGLRLELAVDKIVTCIAVGLPLLLISLAFAQEISLGTQISCFAPSSFSWRQAAYVDSYCWAAVQQKHVLLNDSGNIPLWLHKVRQDQFPSFGKLGSRQRSPYCSLHSYGVKKWLSAILSVRYVSVNLFSFVS
uniref:Pannexin 1 n=1 Tax=Sphenodon punctatus TaxID=8508 RepID=A0A8D0HDC4_SPHPU